MSVLSRLRAFWAIRPYLGAVVGGIVAAGLATAIDMLIRGGDSRTTFLPQAVVAASPVVVTYLYRRDGVVARSDRAGLLAVAALATGLVVVGIVVIGGVVMAEDQNLGQVIRGAVVLLVGAALGLIGFGQLLRR